MQNRNISQHPYDLLGDFADPIHRGILSQTLTRKTILLILYTETTLTTMEKREDHGSMVL